MAMLPFLRPPSRILSTDLAPPPPRVRAAEPRPGRARPRLCSSAGSSFSATAPLANQAGAGPGGLARRQGVNGVSAGRTPRCGKEVDEAGRTCTYVSPPPAVLARGLSLTPGHRMVSMVNAVEEMRGVKAEDVQADGGSGSASSSAAESFEGLGLGCLKVNAAHDNGIGFSGEEHELYQLSTVGAERSEGVEVAGQEMADHGEVNSYVSMDEEKKDHIVETNTTDDFDNRPFKKAKCSESTVLGDPLPSPFVSTSPLVSACSESIDSGSDNQINGYPLPSIPPTMSTLSPVVTELINEEKISADNDEQKVLADDEKLTDEPKHSTNELTYDYLPQDYTLT